jgi:hypothetical protein
VVLGTNRNITRREAKIGVNLSAFHAPVRDDIIRLIDAKVASTGAERL